MHSMNCACVSMQSHMCTYAYVFRFLICLFFVVPYILYGDGVLLDSDLFNSHITRMPWRACVQLLANMHKGTNTEKDAIEMSPQSFS